MSSTVNIVGVPRSRRVGKGTEISVSLSAVPSDRFAKQVNALSAGDPFGPQFMLETRDGHAQLKAVFAWEVEEHKSLLVIEQFIRQCEGCRD